jgi:hypothetical protein
MEDLKHSSEIRLNEIPPTSIASRALNENLPPTLKIEHEPSPNYLKK